MLTGSEELSKKLDVVAISSDQNKLIWENCAKTVGFSKYWRM
jgi:hypothetical protein